MGKTIEVECTADIEIDDYVENISDDVLFEEAISRLEHSTSNRLKAEFTELLIDEDNLFNLISTTKNLSIIDAERVKDFLKTFD
jgi:hypothetical protein